MKFAADEMKMKTSALPTNEDGSAAPNEDGSAAPNEDVRFAH